jgi:hypothetical protein
MEQKSKQRFGRFNLSDNDDGMKLCPHCGKPAARCEADVSKVALEIVRDVTGDFYPFHSLLDERGAAAEDVYQQQRQAAEIETYNQWLYNERNGMDVPLDWKAEAQAADRDFKDLKATEEGARF